MLSERIKTYRKKLGYSQEMLARKLHVTQGAVSQWETGITAPAFEQIVTLATIFGITTDELLGHESEQESIDDEVLALREQLRRDPAYRMLFSAASKATPEHIKAAAAMLKALEGDNDD